MKFIINYLLKKNLIKLSKIEDTFFLYKQLDKRLVLTEEIIALNYLNESPFPLDESATIAIMDKEKLYLWFVKKSQNRYLPEALALYRKMLQTHSTIIVVFQSEIDKVIVIKDSFLISSFSKSMISEQDLLLMKHEYGVSEVLWLKDKVYKNYLEESLTFLKFKDILSILNIQFDLKKFMITAIKWFSIPILIASILITLLLAGYSYLIVDKNINLYASYKDSQSSTIKIKNKIENYEIKNKVFNQLSKEFRYVDKSLVLSKILTTARDLNMTMVYLKIYDTHAQFIIRTKKRSLVPLYIKELFKTELFEDIKNPSSQKQRDKSIEVKIRAKLKERI